jgi:hypothetical protein
MLWNKSWKNQKINLLVDISLTSFLWKWKCHITLGRKGSRISQKVSRIIWMAQKLFNWLNSSFPVNSRTSFQSLGDVRGEPIRRFLCFGKKSILLVLEAFPSHGNLMVSISHFKSQRTVKKVLLLSEQVNLRPHSYETFLHTILR